jgi:hypothetical protein
MVSNLVDVVKGPKVSRLKIIILREGITGLRQIETSFGFFMLRLIISYLLVAAGAVWLTFSLMANQAETATALQEITMENGFLRESIDLAIAFLIGLASTLVGAYIYARAKPAHSAK